MHLNARDSTHRQVAVLLVLASSGPAAEWALLCIARPLGDDLPELRVLGLQPLGGEPEIGDDCEDRDDLIGVHAAATVVTVPDEPRYLSAPAST